MRRDKLEGGKCSAFQRKDRKCENIDQDAFGSNCHEFTAMYFFKVGELACSLPSIFRIAWILGCLYGSSYHALAKPYFKEFIYSVGKYYLKKELSWKCSNN
jgi:hypothetical protein